MSGVFPGRISNTVVAEIKVWAGQTLVADSNDGLDNYQQMLQFRSDSL